MKNWIKAARLRTLPLAFAAIGMGGLLGIEQNNFDVPTFFLSLLTALLLQVVSNLANDYGDFKKGVDSERKGEARMVQSGKISAKAMKKAIYLSSALSFISGCVLLWVSPVSMLAKGLLLLLGIVAILSAILYTNGRRPYGYQGFGDLFVFIFFGPVSAAGTAFLTTNLITVESLIMGAAIGLLCVGVLNINNLRDFASDKKAGKRSLVVLLGINNALVYHFTLLFTPFLLAGWTVLRDYQHPLQWLFLLTLPLFIYNYSQVRIRATSGGDLDPFLKQLSISTLNYVIFYGIGILIG